MIRKIAAVLLALLLTVTSVLATETEPTIPVETSVPPETTIPPETQSPTIPTELVLETQHAYDGIETSYQEGYIPVCENGRVRIVLPICSTGPLYGDQLIASLVLDGGAFVAANFEKTFPLERVPFEEETIEVFLVDFTVTLSDERQNGTYPVTIRLSTHDSLGVPVTASHTLYVTISDVPEETVPPVTQPPKPTAEPVVYIAGTTVAPEPVMAGEEFILTLKLKNSLDTKSVRNLLVTVDTGNKQLELLEEGAVFQLDRIAAGGEEELSLLMKADASIPAGKYTIHVHFRYDSSEVLGLSSSGSTTVEIRQPTRIELVTTRFPDSVTVGETIPVPLQVLNMGKDMVYNVRCTLSGIGLSPSNTGYIGTMTAGSSAETNLDVYIMALNTAEGNEQGSPYGPTGGTITLLYEDASGQEYKQETRFQTTVNRPIVVLQTEPNVEEQENEAAGQWWAVMLIVGGVGLACIIGTILARRKHSVSG